MEEVKKCLSQLPGLHRVIITYLMAFLSRVAAHSDINKMTPLNLVFVHPYSLMSINSLAGNCVRTNNNAEHGETTGFECTE